MASTMKLPVGIDDFRKLRESHFYYVDKTRLIEQLLLNWSEVTLFTRPRRFGKTLNMSMLKSFFDIGTDETLFDGLYISGNKELCDEYMGKYPVIFLSLKGVEGLTYEEAFEAFVRIMGPADEDKKYAKECYDLVESLGVQDVEFTGRVNVKDYLGKMDFTLLTSISEGQPLTILESYAAHKPVIATDVGNCRELIYGNNDGFGEAGILTHIMNIEEIAHAMVTMSVNEKDRRRMGEAGYRRVNALYRIDQMKEVYREIYKGFSDRQNLSWTEEPFQISVYER